VHTAFSGAHQDGISKGLAAMKIDHVQADLCGRSRVWSIPYLPVDPCDFGFSYIPIRVNSQSGKGGVSYIIKETLNIDIPRAMQVEFHSFIQNICESQGRKLTSAEITSQFRQLYHYCEPQVDSSERILLHYHAQRSIEAKDKSEEFSVTVIIDGISNSIPTDLNDPLQSFLDTITAQLNCSFRVMEEASGKMTSGVSTCIMLADSHGDWWGVGVGGDQIESRLRAGISAVNCAMNTSNL
jgi:2-isopropylmalate synthase